MTTNTKKDFISPATFSCRDFNCSSFSIIATLMGGSLHGVMVKVMDCGIVVNKFVLQSCYYIHFRANTLTFTIQKKN